MEKIPILKKGITLQELLSGFVNYDEGLYAVRIQFQGKIKFNSENNRFSFSPFYKSDYEKTDSMPIDTVREILNEHFRWENKRREEGYRVESDLLYDFHNAIEYIEVPMDKNISDNEILKALDTALQFIGISDNLDGIQIDGEMVNYYEIMELVRNAKIGLEKRMGEL